MSVWLPTAPCTPVLCLADGSPPTVGRPRRLARAAAFLTVVLLGLLVLPLARRTPKLIRSGAQALPTALGVRIRITGEPLPPSGGVLIVANHISWLDIPLLAAVRPARMLAKREVGTWPVLGPLIARAGTLFIDRDRLRALPQVVSDLADALRSGSAVVVFPEGSTWCGRSHGRFRPAAFQAALDAGVPVQPVRIRYRLSDASPATLAAFVGDDTLLASLRRVTAARGLVAEVHVLPAIPYGAYGDRRALAHAAQATVEPPAPAPAVRECPTRAPITRERQVTECQSTPRSHPGGATASTHRTKRTPPPAQSTDRKDHPRRELSAQATPVPTPAIAAAKAKGSSGSETAPVLDPLTRPLTAAFAGEPEVTRTIRTVKPVTGTAQPGWRRTGGLVRAPTAVPRRAETSAASSPATAADPTGISLT
jgi:1-acyl-sn-glycerol-3-phosphate acyltransferase